MKNELDRISVTLVASVITKIDEYLKTDEAKGGGFTSRPDIIYESLRLFFKEVNELNKHAMISLSGFVGTQIFLYDSVEGSIVVKIDKENKLQCYNCKEDPHNNKYVNYCLKNQELWEFLKSQNVKLVVPRE